MKKIILGILIVCMILIVGCGKESNDSKETDGNEKGSRNNPYKVGDTITIKDAYNIYDEYDGKPFDITVCVEEAYTLDQGKEMYKGRRYNNVPSAKISFSITSDYQDSKRCPVIFKVVSEDMKDHNYGTMDTKDYSSITNFYPNADYQVLVTTACDSETGDGEEPKYVTIYYYQDKGKDSSKTIYVDLSE